MGGGTRLPANGAPLASRDSRNFPDLPATAAGLRGGRGEGWLDFWQRWRPRPIELAGGPAAITIPRAPEMKAGAGPTPAVEVIPLRLPRRARPRQRITSPGPVNVMAAAGARWCDESPAKDARLVKSIAPGDGVGWMSRSARGAETQASWRSIDLGHRRRRPELAGCARVPGKSLACPDPVDGLLGVDTVDQRAARPLHSSPAPLAHVWLRPRVRGGLTDVKGCRRDESVRHTKSA